jgi:putative methionine-R-sulfoxide reductase with GAF domain
MLMNTKSPLFACAAAALLSIPFAARAADMVVIKNNKVEAAKITKAELKEMLTGKTKFWKNGKSVQVVLGGEGTPESAWVAGFVFGVGESAMITKMKQETFKGELKKVVNCTGGDECGAAVKANEGGLGVVPGDTKLPAGVEVLAIE